MASTTLRAQSYGLRFTGQEDIQDRRTTLDLTPEKPLCVDGNLEIAFDLSLVPNYRTYFGYIFRIIQDDKKNLDLIYDQKSTSFKIIIGERFSQSIIKLDSTQLFNRWTTFRIQLDLNTSTLRVYTNNKLVIKDNVPFTESGCFRVFFGGNEFREFKSKDLPPMNLREIVVSENGQRMYYWPLNEVKGALAKDEVTGQAAVVKNPVWIKSLHTAWKVAEQVTINGNASAAFDPSTETVYVVGSDRVYSYSAQKHEREFRAQKSPPPSFLPGNQSVFNPFSNRLYNFYVDQKAIAAYDSVSKSWRNESLIPKYTIATEYWQANKFISGVDSALYILGGYGQLTYKNSIQRYHFGSRKWETVPAKGSAYTPRYLAALGTTPTADTAYLIGGYGSLTGEQMLNPKSTYDFLRYTVSDNTFKKLYELPLPKTDFAFANSLIIDSKSGLYYGLIFPNQQFKSQLQLIRGSLTQPTYESVGTPIPYQFHDTHAFSDLYYCAASQQLLAVTLYRNEQKGSTDVKIYSIAFPPNVLESQATPEKQSTRVYWFWGIAGLVAGGLALFYFRRRGRNVQTKDEFREADQETMASNPPVQTEQIEFVPIPGPKASFFFFGNFQAFDQTGSDTTKAFTPLLKELFLLLALNSIGKHRGVPSEKLNELLWPDKSGRDASNNRSVNITKLRSLLDKVGGCSLSKESGYWNITFDFSQVYVDYERYMALINDKSTLTKQTIIELGELTKQGSFLLNTEYAWLDDFKAEISNKIINTFLQYADKLRIGDDPEFLIQLTNFIFYYDPVNEDAIILKCKALAWMGKHTLAKNAFEKFTRDFKTIYGEDYKQSFSAIID
ncbi:galactose oxidase [Spirosoma arboris]|nr:galactose oxidase [Spirosoma arboris]